MRRAGAVARLAGYARRRPRAINAGQAVLVRAVLTAGLPTGGMAGAASIGFARRLAGFVANPVRLNPEHLVGKVVLAILRSC